MPPVNYSFIRICLLLVLYLPVSLGAVTLEDARHLALRTGFTLVPDTFAQWQRYGKRELVRDMLESPGTSQINPPPWVDQPRFRIGSQDGLTTQESVIMLQTFNRQIRAERRKDLQGWWFLRAAKNSSPLTERMTLFWHNHFTSGYPKVDFTRLLYQQNQLFRRHALGNFRDMLHDVAQDPSILFYLDNHLNTKKKPNENWARELLELYTLGEGNYTEKDVKEAARAFTGWSINNETMRYVFKRGEHDYANKQFMGETGPFNGNDIVEIILSKPETAHFIVTKLWREFISPDPDQKRVKEWASSFRGSGYELKPLVKTILLSDEFWDANNRNKLIKSPLELLVGAVKSLGITLEDAIPLAKESTRLGQTLFSPPDVKGWPGYTNWIDESRLIKRQEILLQLLKGYEFEAKTIGKSTCQSFDNADDSQKQTAYRPDWVELAKQDSPEGRKQLHIMMLGEAYNKAEPIMSKALVEFLRSILIHPAYQLR